VEIGTWIGLAHQGHGYGTEARTTVLKLAFTHLGAVARTEYIDGNETQWLCSQARLPRNGHKVTARDGQRLLQRLMVIDADTQTRHSMPIRARSFPPLWR
jgi:hypothetical protein